QVASSQDVSCFGNTTGSITLTVSAGTAPYNFNWSNGATTQNLLNIPAGTYSVTVTDANNCSTFLSAITIQQPAGALAASVSGMQNVNCYGQSTGAINLNVSGGTSPYSYNWSNGAVTQNLSNLSAGSYSVTVTDANNCSTTINAIVVAEPPAVLFASVASTSNVSCNAGANGAIDLNVSGGTSPYSFNWSNGATTEDIAGLSSGSYSVTVTDANGCTYSVSEVITQPSAGLSASVSSTQNVNCFGGNNASVQLTGNGGTSPYSYNWSNGATSQNISSITAGVYTVTVTDANGCTDVQS